jgi:exodeoxyribonuclease VIII
MKIVENLSFDEYKSSPGIHKSTLSEMSRSPAHYKWALENQRETTAAMRFGSLVHCLVLEPASFDAAYYVAEETIRRGTKAWDALEAKARGREILKPDEYAEACAMRDAIRVHPKAGEVLAACTMREASMFWSDPQTGLGCKARCDAMSVEHSVIADVKTCQDASNGAFMRDIVNYKYHWQAAMYVDGAEAIAKKPFLFVFIAVEKAPPYGVAVYLISEAFIAAGRKGYKDALQDVLLCMTNNTWPCYAEGAVEIQAPAWMEKAAQ